MQLSLRNAVLPARCRFRAQPKLSCARLLNAPALAPTIRAALERLFDRCAQADFYWYVKKKQNKKMKICKNAHLALFPFHYFFSLAKRSGNNVSNSEKCGSVEIIAFFFLLLGISTSFTAQGFYIFRIFRAVARVWLGLLPYISSRLVSSKRTPSVTGLGSFEYFRQGSSAPMC